MSTPEYFKAFLQTVRKIPRGKVATYGDIAYASGYPGMARQVAWALHNSSAGLPWHRVIGADGKILLTGEHGFEQRMRLQAEGVRLIGGLRVAINEHRHAFFRSAERNSSATQRRAKPAAKSSKSGRSTVKTAKKSQVRNYRRKP